MRLFGPHRAGARIRAGLRRNRSIVTTLASLGALTDRACPCCGTRLRTTLLEDQYLADAPADKMSVVECRGCSLIYTAPIVHGPLGHQPPDSYDIVTLWCVVAHEPDFMALLADCHRLLRRGGIILIETPNMTLWRTLHRCRRLLERLSLRPKEHDAVAA